MKNWLIVLFLIGSLSNITKANTLYFEVGTQVVDNKAQVAEITSLLKGRDVQIKKLLGAEGSTYTDEQREELKNIINGIIDYDAMAQIALQTTYNEISAEQKKEFVDVFSTIIRDQSLAKLDIYRATVTYDEITVDGVKATVKTTASLKDVKTPVSYSMEKKNKEWMITDMQIDNVSTAESYQKSFQGVIRKKGFDALMKSLRKRVERGKN